MPIAYKIPSQEVAESLFSDNEKAIDTELNAAGATPDERESVLNLMRPVTLDEQETVAAHIEPHPTEDY